MDRRAFLKLLLSLPVVGGLGLFVSPLLRYLRPSLGPLAATQVDTSKGLLKVNGNTGLFTPGDQPQREKEVVFKLTDFAKPWDSQTFTFGQRSKEFTFKQFQSVRIPGFVVRMPDKDGQLDFSVVSRICPHMGCVFNYIPPEQATAYNYNQAVNPLFACPCHLSVFDPKQVQPVDGKNVAGKVVSGPAPRPPRQFEWSVRGDELVIVAVETGGIS
ncbi:MAG: ubiquinol-cytochrome c reductase iron-sulfur subunit [Vampirovibrionales bacterium]